MAARIGLEEELGVPMDSLRIVYDINGEFSGDISHGVTAHWTQRHNPFLGKGLNGSAVLDFIDRVNGHRVLFATSSSTSTSRPRTGVLFSLFNYPRGYAGEHCCVEKAFADLAVLLGNSAAPCLVEAADETFNIDGVSFAQEFGSGAVSTPASVHYRAIYIPLAPNAFAADAPPYTCCDMHRCVSYVASPSVCSRTVVKEYWFFEPLTWLDAACGVHDDTFFFTERGARFKPLVTSELSDLEACGRAAAKFLPGSDAHLRFIARLRSTHVAVRRRFFKTHLYSVPVISELLIAWAERSKGADTVAEIVGFIEALAVTIPYSERDAFLQTMYMRFSAEWLCTHVSLLYTTFLAQLARHRCEHLHAVRRVGCRPGVPESVRGIIVEFCRPVNMLSAESINASVFTLNDYMWAEPWWYKAVLSNVHTLFKCVSSVAGCDGSCSWLWYYFVGARRPVCLEDAFILEASRWRVIITDPRVLERYDVIVKALSMGGDPFEFIKTPKTGPPLSLCCNPTEVIVLCALSLAPDPAVLGRWKHRCNRPAFVAFINIWTPLLFGYEYAADILSRISETASDSDDYSEDNDFSEHWRHFMLPTKRQKIY